MITIRLTNESGDDAITPYLEVIARAVEQQCNLDFKPIWGRDAVAIRAGGALQDGEWPARVVESLDDPTALAVHEAVAGYPLLLVGRDVILDHGGTILSGANSIAAGFGHEVLETLMDPFCDYWAQALPNLRARAGNASARFVALECVDAVQDQTYEIRVGEDSVSVPNFVTPEWFRAGASRQKFDFLGNLSEPQTLSDGGYVELDTGEPIFGDRVPAFRRALVRTRSRRRRRRSR